MDLKKTASAEPLLPPQALKCLHTDIPEEAPLKWKPVKKSKTYLIEQTADDPNKSDTWTSSGTSTKAAFTVKDLEPLKQYWFRVCAVGSLGKSPWSDPAKRMVS